MSDQVSNGNFHVAGRCLLGALAMVLCCGLRAQTELSTLRGTVTDTSGAVVSGATVTAEEITTNVRARSVTTDNVGNYEMPDLKPGMYRVRAVLRGFKTFIAENIPLESDQAKRVDIVLQVGDPGTEVTVSGAAPVIETEEGKITAEFSARQYRDLPMPGNAYSSPIPVLATMAQVQTDEGSYNVYFAGQGGAQLDMGMDGVKEESMNTQTVNMESVEEVKIVVVNNSAEYSRVGYYNVVNKSGGNQFHGEGSYYLRNSALGARGFFEPEKARVIYNTFNLSASGPIIKNKTFFYALWNAERVPGGAFHLTDVPTNQMRTGDFSELLALSPPVQITDPLNGGAPFAGNMIPPGRLNAVALKLTSQYMPAPNLGGPHDLTNNFGFTWHYPDDQYHADVVVTRLDHRFTEKNSLYGRFSAYLPRYVLVGNYPSLFWTRLRQSHSWAIVDTHLFSPYLVNTFTFGGNRDRVSDGETVDNHTPAHGDKVVADLGITGVNPQGLSAMGFPVMDIAGYSGTGNFAGTFNTQAGGVSQLTRNLTYADSLSWAAGKHVWKFGTELRTYRNFNGSVPQNTYGYFTFDGSITGNAWADFLLGIPQNSQRLNPIINRVQREKELGLFVTDTFKVTSRLTLDYGLRWEYFGSPSFEDGLVYNWDPTTGNVIVPRSALSKVSPYYPTNIKIVAGQAVPSADLGDWRPRIGAAYRLTPKTVLRGGYGIFSEVLGNNGDILSPNGLLAQGGGPLPLARLTSTAFKMGSRCSRCPIRSLPARPQS